MRKLLLGTVFLATGASAQMSMPTFNMYPAIGAQMLQKQIDAQRSRSGDAVRAERPASAATSLRFPASPRARKANLTQLVDRMRRSDPQSAAELENLIANQDLIATMGRELAPFGLRVDNLADAYTVWWMNAWQAAHGDTSPPDRDQAQAVKAQATRALLATPEVAAATDAQKQEFAEALLVQAALIGSFQEKYKDDATQTRRLAAAVRQGAKASGVDLDAMTLTPEGFVPADKLGAADTPASGGTSPLLLAAAGGVGLGGVFLLGRAAGRRG